MSLFRKKPVVIEAVRWDGNVIMGGCPDWLAAVGEDLEAPPETVEPGRVAFCGDAIFIGTLEGMMRVDAGDFIIKGTADEIYPCKPEIFAGIYDPVDEAAARALSDIIDGQAAEPPPGVGRHELTAPGRCRICGCTDNHACDGGCAWADKGETLCDNPDCVAAAGEGAADA